MAAGPRPQQDPTLLPPGDRDHPPWGLSSQWGSGRAGSQPSSPEVNTVVWEERSAHSVIQPMLRGDLDPAPALAELPTWGGTLDTESTMAKGYGKD